MGIRSHPHGHHRLNVTCRQGTDRTRVHLVDDIQPMPKKPVSIRAIDITAQQLTSLPRQVAANKFKITNDSGLSVVLNSVKASATEHPTQSVMVHSWVWWPFPRKWACRMGSCSKACKMTFMKQDCPRFQRPLTPCLAQGRLLALLLTKSSSAEFSILRLETT